MGLRHSASGFVGVLFLATIAFAPTFLAHAATAKVRAVTKPTDTASAGPSHRIVDRKGGRDPVTKAELEAETPETPETPPARVIHAVPKASPVSAVDLDALRMSIAQQLETLPICRRGGGPEGPGVAEVTFMGDGTARVALSSPYANTSVGGCVARRFAVPARNFEGTPVTIRVRFEL